MSLFEEIDLTERALGYCSAATIGITRFGEDSLFNHSLRVKKMVAKLWPEDNTAQVAALLHDLVEDTAVTLEMVEFNFGSKIAKTVDALTTRTGESYEAYYRRLLETGDNSALRVKYCDGLDNSDICVGLIDAENVSVKSFLYFRAKYRIATGIAERVLKQRCGANDPICNVHNAILHRWASEYDTATIRRLRDGALIKLHPKGRIAYVVDFYDENPQWHENSFYGSPWGIEVEMKLLGKDARTSNTSNHLLENMLSELSRDVNLGMFKLNREETA